jgi:hemerythrin-like metal-binding protein
MKIEYIKWDKEYSVDVPEIDTQHKELMNIINHFIRNCTGDMAAEKAFFDKIIDIGIKEIERHFNTEEKILDKTKYGKLEEHKAEHKIFLNKLKTIVNEIKEGKREINLTEMTINVKEWLLTHIIAYDKEAKEYFKGG